MEIKTKLNIGDIVLGVFDGKLAQVKIQTVKFHLDDLNQSKGGDISYGAVRLDIRPDIDSPFDKVHFSFPEETVGVTIFHSKKDMLSYMERLEPEPVRNPFVR